ncbi:MAG: HDOD domain-containing protein [Pirellulaceae bacterium]|nr:HDOD domain-containing protein [Pirellulaceae bacterium]
MNETTSEAPVFAQDIPPERRKVLERLFKLIGSVTSLPTVGQRVLVLTENETTSFEELRDVIQSDPVLVARMLRRLNSSYFGLSHRIADVRTAVNLLGVLEIRNLAITVCMSKMFEGDGSHGAYRRELLWSHSVAVGVCARLVARVCGRGMPGEAYVAGLLHDLGLILLDQTLRRHFVRVLGKISPTVSTCEAELKVFSFDHATLGGYVAQRWNFPEQIVDAITFHHHPLSYKGPHQEMVYLVALANFLCSQAGRTSLGVHNVAPPPEEVYSRLGLDEISLKVIESELEAKLDNAEALAASS